MESFIIEIESDKVEPLLSEFEGDLAFLCSHLKLMDNKMCLLNPKFATAEENTIKNDESHQTEEHHN